MRNQKTQGQIFIAFAVVHLVLSTFAGYCWWYVADSGMRNQAAHNAESVARVISQGGFTLNKHILHRMQELSTYEFEVREKSQNAVKPGLIEIPFADGSSQVVAINYLNSDNTKTLEGIYWTSIFLVLAGILLFLPVAWILAKRFARPLEDLSLAAQRIGDGDWDAVVSTSGNREATALAQQLDNMRLQLKHLDAKHRQAEHLATLGTFTATIAHEVRNPLSAVRLLIQMLQRDNDDARLQHVEQELQRLDLIVDELLGFSAGMNVHLEPCDLLPCCNYVMQLLSRQAEHADVKMRISGSTTVMADERRLQQLLMNLI
ncbi:MAG: HAMP domain-containing histidine kinase, partial [Planctomycetes bacterium]|nr:HAMP domain-containing histidine kinase [Planctomycetota bacterium]